MMTKALQKYVGAALALVIALALSGCGAKKAEITTVAISESNVLNIAYSAGANIEAGDAMMEVRVSGSGDDATGSVYSRAGIEGDMERGRKYLALFDMNREWKVDGILNVKGTGVTNSFTGDILSLLGDDAAVTCALIVNGETVSELPLSSE